MLIGIDASRANKKNKTGVEWYSYHLIEALKKNDRENQYFLYTDKPLEGKLGVCPSNFSEKILKWPFGKFWTLGRLSLEMLFGEKPDVLFVPAHTLPLITPNRSVVTVHDIGFERFPEVYKWPDIVYHRFAIKNIKRASAQIITVSEFSKKEIIDVYKISAEKITAIPIGFSPPHFDMDFVREETRKIGGLPFILFVGRLEEKKNICRMLEAFAKIKNSGKIPDLRFVLAGRPGFGFEKIKKKIVELNLLDDVIFTGWINNDELGFLYQRAKVLLFATLYEGFGIPPLEAMSVDCPVVCSNATSLPEVVGDAAILVDPLSVDYIAAGLSAALFDDEKRKILIERGRERVKLFSWEKCAAETLKVL
jgi:glycosyltransferase involved in cell wall biosynthesis